VKEKAPEDPRDRLSVDYSRLDDTPFAHGRLKDLNVLVVGAGALGNEAIRILGLIGVGHVLVADPDTVEPSNLTRSVFFRMAGAVGKNKAVAIAEAARLLMPDTTVEAFPLEVADIGFQRISRAGLVFGCVDNDLARVETAYVSTALDIPVIDAGMGSPDRAEGRVSFFPGRGAACFSCLLTSRRRREILTLWQSPSLPCWDTGDAARARPVPSTPTLAALMGALQVELGLRRVLHPDEGSATEAETTEISLASPQRLSAHKLPLDRTCPFHEPEVSRVASPGPESETTVERLLESAGSGEWPCLQLDWPVCVRAACLECTHTWSPMLRVAAFRRRAPCPRCGTSRVQELEVLRSIPKDSPWASFPLAKIGVPEHHLHTISDGRRSR